MSNNHTTSGSSTFLEQLALADVQFIQGATERLEDRVRNCAATLAKLLAAICGGLIAAAEFTQTRMTFISTYSTWIAWGLLFLSVYALTLCVSAARDRRHYIRALGMINLLRARYGQTLGLSADIPAVWMKKPTGVWPLDSVSTHSLLLLVAMNTGILIASLALFGFGAGPCLLIGTTLPCVTAIVATKVSEP